MVGQTQALIGLTYFENFQNGSELNVKSFKQYKCDNLVSTVIIVLQQFPGVVRSIGFNTLIVILISQSVLFQWVMMEWIKKGLFFTIIFIVIL